MFHQVTSLAAPVIFPEELSNTLDPSECVGNCKDLALQKLTVAKAKASKKRKVEWNSH